MRADALRKELGCFAKEDAKEDAAGVLTNENAGADEGAERKDAAGLFAKEITGEPVGPDDAAEVLENENDGEATTLDDAAGLFKNENADEAAAPDDAAGLLANQNADADDAATLDDPAGDIGLFAKEDAAGVPTNEKCEICRFAAKQLS